MILKVFSIEYKQKMCHSCRVCGKLLSEGQFAVIVTIEVNEGDKKVTYTLCVSPPIECCEGTLDIQHLFAIQAEADAKAQEVRERIASYRGKDESVLSLELDLNFVEITE